VTSEAPVSAGLDAIGMVTWCSMLDVLPAEDGADRRCRQRVTGAGVTTASDRSNDGGWRHGCDGHELSNPIVGMGHSRGWQPGSTM
jgi:hypothetical protein